jgi:hypothetical protein
VLTDEFPAERRYLRQLTGLVEKFQPGAPYLPAVSSNLASITRNGPESFNHLYRTSPAFDKTLKNLGNFSADPQVRLGLTGLQTFLETINQPLEYITPSQTVCNYFGLFARNISSVLSSRDAGISWLRFGLVGGWQNPTPRLNSEIGPGNGIPNFGQTLGTLNASNYLQTNGYPTTGQNNVCGAGNEVTKGNRNSNTPSLPGNPRTAQPSGIKSGKTTEDTKATGTQQVKTK